jgi:alpha-beta hydrolase superfamily lysophospholipase
MRRLIRLVALALLIIAAAVVLWPAPEDRGRSQLFTDSTYSFEAVRVLNDVAAAGGDSEETLRTVASIKAGDADAWYRAWSATADRTRAWAKRTLDRQARGEALLRAHTYYRAAEFFLAPEDARRPGVFKQNTEAFYEGLDTLGVTHERIAVPYGSHHLNAVYYPGPPGSESRPLLMVVGGYDSTLEELYLSIAAAAVQHGYSVLTYEGPGQGSVLRDQSLHMQADWEKPNGAVLDQFLSTHAKPKKIVLLGESLGGYLAPRAAAFEPRIDGVVAFDVWFDGYAIATRRVAPIAFWLRAHGYNKLLTYLASKTTDPGARWAQQNGEWVFGVSDPFAVLDAFKAYRLGPVADRITQDVLLLAGADDHFVPFDQLEPERQSLTHARSVTAIAFDRDSGGALHCQIGAPSLWQATLFDWMQAKFGSGGS